MRASIFKDFCIIINSKNRPKMLTGVKDVVHVTFTIQIGFFQVAHFFVRFAILFLELKFVGARGK